MSETTWRPLRRSDLPVVLALMERSELAETGEVSIEEADLVADWQVPGFEPEERTWSAWRGGELLGYAEHDRHDRGDLALDPGHVTRAVAGPLTDWLAASARRAGAPAVGVPVPADAATDRVLADLGWHVRWRTWVLRLPPGANIPERALPPGWQVGEAEPPEYVALHAVLEDAFLEWADRPRETFERFSAKVLDRPGFAPWLLRVVRDPEGVIVAAASCTLDGATTYVHKVATRHTHRGRGLAQALLADCFAAGRAQGGEVAELATDSRTGALDLYRKLGMVVVAEWVNRAVDL